MQYFLRERPWTKEKKHPDVLGEVVFTYEKVLKSDCVINDSLGASPQVTTNVYVPISLAVQNGMCPFCDLPPTPSSYRRVALVLNPVIAVEPLLLKRTLGDNGTGSKESWQCIFEWMRVCVDSHTRCNQERTPNWWPT